MGRQVNPEISRCLQHLCGCKCAIFTLRIRGNIRRNLFFFFFFLFFGVPTKDYLGARHVINIMYLSILLESRTRKLKY